jgi:hypothetical protein
MRVFQLESLRDANQAGIFTFPSHTHLLPGFTARMHSSLLMLHIRHRPSLDARNAPR